MAVHYTDVIKSYRSTGSMRETARLMGISASSVRRILIDAGEYRNEAADRVSELINRGKNVDEIAAELKVTRKYVQSLIPYTKGAYCVGDKSVNAARIAKCRGKKTE